MLTYLWCHTDFIPPQKIFNFFYLRPWEIGAEYQKQKEQQISEVK